VASCCASGSQLQRVARNSWLSTIPFAPEPSRTPRSGTPSVERKTIALLRSPAADTQPSIGGGDWGAADTGLPRSKSSNPTSDARRITAVLDGSRGPRLALEVRVHGHVDV